MNEWIRFKERKPNAGQPILIAWENKPHKPEYRELSEIQLLKDWEGIILLPIPPYNNLPSPPKE